MSIPNLKTMRTQQDSNLVKLYMSNIFVYYNQLNFIELKLFETKICSDFLITLGQYRYQYNTKITF